MVKTTPMAQAIQNAEETLEQRKRNARAARAILDEEGHFFLDLAVQRYQQAHPDVSYADALRAVSGNLSKIVKGDK